MGTMLHYTDKKGYNGIPCGTWWRFLAHKPPCEHPCGAYFTNLSRTTKHLALKLRIAKEKTDYYFEFLDCNTLLSLKGGRGKYIFYSLEDYTVERPRQLSSGSTE